jgi:hypothetical protein
MTECPFQATVKKLQQDVEWTVTCDRPEHNHEPSDTPATHPSLRKPTIDELDIITSLTSSNIRPKAMYHCASPPGRSYYSPDPAGGIQL